MRTTFIKTLLDCAREDERIFLITADLGYSVLEEFAETFPKRFLNVGVAEQNAVGVAAGLAMSGRIAYVYSIVPFVTMRCFEQVRVDVAYLNTNVRLVGVGAGLSYGPAGATHHSIEDIAIMRALPGMTVLCPGDPLEVEALTRQSASHRGPVYLRLGKAGEPRIHEAGARIQLGKAARLTDGPDFALLTTSNMLETGAKLVAKLATQGLKGTLLSLHTIKPFDAEAIRDLIGRGLPIFTLEEHSLIGGLGSAVAELIAESGRAVKFRRLALPDEYTHLVGSQEHLRARYSLDFEALSAQIPRLL